LQFRWVGTADEGDEVEQVPWLDWAAASKADVPSQVWLEKKVLFDRFAISSAFFEFPSGEDKYPMLKLQFNPEATDRLAELTEQHRGRRLAVLIGGKMVAGVIIKTHIANGQFVIGGTFTDDEIAAITSSGSGKRSDHGGFPLGGDAKLHPSEETGKLNDVTTMTVGLAPNFEFHWVAKNARSEKAFEVAWREQSGTSGTSNLLIAGEVLFDLTAITSVSLEERGDPNEDTTIRLRFSEDAAHRLAELTKNNVGRRMAILLDGKVLMAPTIQGPITEGLVAITGKFTLEELSNLVASVGPGAVVKGSMQ
jgi:preprotein translocase subunit SecD